MPNHSMSGTDRKPASLTRKIQPQSKSDYIFRPHKPADGERKTHGLVDVYVRATGEHIGMMNPHTDGGYVLRDRNGDRLGADNCGYIEDLTYLSREPSARILKARIDQRDRMLSRREGSVSQGCPNDWHNTGEYKASTACPECPSQLGLKYAVQLLEANHPDAAHVLRGEIYTPAD